MENDGLKNIIQDVREDYHHWSPPVCFDGGFPAGKYHSNDQFPTKITFYQLLLFNQHLSVNK